MADIAFIDDLKQIKSLWLNVFAGDDDKTVEYFYKNCVHKKCLGAFCDDKPVSMLFLVDCGYCGKKEHMFMPCARCRNSEVGAFREA